MEPLVIAEFTSAVFIGIGLIGQYYTRSKSESGRWLRMCATTTCIYLLIDGLSVYSDILRPFVLGYVVNLLSYVLGSVALIFFCKYCESYIGERTAEKPKGFRIPIALDILFAAGTMVLFFCNKLVVYENRVEIDCYDYPVWIRAIQIAAMLLTSIIAISKWKSIGMKAVILLGLFILAPALATIFAIYTEVDASIVVAAIILALIMEILQNDQLHEQQNQIVQTQEYATTDPLTHVKNDLAYTAMSERLNKEIAEQSAPEFALVFCDVNSLKYTNDTYGHETGDVYIQNACRIICEVYARSPVYRIGGDEFVVVLQGHDYINRGECLALLHQRIRDAEAIESIADGHASLAAGMAEFDPHTDTDIRDVQSRADAEMYKEKGNKKRR